MYEKATLKNGGIEQTNFDTYTPLRMSQVPEVAVSVIANGEKATGVGEPAVTVIAPRLANAIFNACGARVRSLPITAEAVRGLPEGLKSRTAVHGDNIDPPEVSSGGFLLANALRSICNSIRTQAFIIAFNLRGMPSLQGCIGQRPPVTEDP